MQVFFLKEKAMSDKSRERVFFHVLEDEKA